MAAGQDVIPSYQTISGILDSNCVHAGWKDVFRSNGNLRRSLCESLGKLEGISCIPSSDNILRCLSRCPPAGIKVVIVGHDPIPDIRFATGFAFSLPAGQMIDTAPGSGREPKLFDFIGKIQTYTGQSVAILHDVLAGVGYLEKDKCYDCCHEIWAERGVLLINASLTFKDSLSRHEHFEIWKEFTKQILLEVAIRSVQPRVFFLFWGTFAEHIGKELCEVLTMHPKSVNIHVTSYKTYKTDKTDISDLLKNMTLSGSTNDPNAKIRIHIGDHPTFPRQDNHFIDHGTLQFTEIKNVYSVYHLFDLNPVENPHLISNQVIF